MADPTGRARHSVRAADCCVIHERRARSDAPYLVTKLICRGTTWWLDGVVLRSRGPAQAHAVPKAFMEVEQNNLGKHFDEPDRDGQFDFAGDQERDKDRI